MGIERFGFGLQVWRVPLRLASIAAAIGAGAPGHAARFDTEITTAGASILAPEAMPQRLPTGASAGPGAIDGDQRLLSIDEPDAAGPDAPAVYTYN